LHNNGRGFIESWEEFMKCPVQMGSDATIYILSFIKTGSGIQKLVGGHTDTDSTVIA
jgi:hypothetical protein